MWTSAPSAARCCWRSALYLIAALLVWLQARLLNVVVQRTMVALRSDVEDKVHRLPLSYFDSRQRGEVLSRVTNDIDNISDLAVDDDQPAAHLGADRASRCW